MSKKLSVAALAILALALSGWPSARADILFSDFGPGDTYDPGSGYTISGSTSPVGQTDTQGGSFTSGTSGAVSQIDVAFFYVAGPGTFNLGLYADDGSGHPGALIESYLGVGPAVGVPGSVLSVSSALHPVLTAGVTYWLIASATDSGTWDAWNNNSSGATGTRYLDLGGVISYDQAAVLPTFRIIASAVPEPSSLALVALGAAGIAGLARRRR